MKKLRLFKNKSSWSGGIPKAVQGSVETVLLQTQALLANECQHFLSCMRGGRHPVTNSEEALRVVEIAGRVEEQIRQSQSTNLTVMRDASASRIDRPLPHLTIDCRSRTNRIRHGGVSNLSGSLVNGGLEKNTNYNSLVELLAYIMDPISLLDLRPQKVRIQENLDLRIAKVLNHMTVVLGSET